jgi:predicted deacylase
MTKNESHSMEPTPIEIQSTIFGPGEKGSVRLHVGRLPSATPIGIHVEVYNSEVPGPRVLIMAGVHGDEINGVEIVRRCIAQGIFDEIVRGSLIVVPLLNVYGFINFSREVPDGKDVNRSFPGSARGSLASRVARVVTRRLLPLVDFAVDFHTGGSNNYNYPQIRYTKGHAESETLARQFAPPILLAKRPISKSFRKVAVDAGKPVLIYEGGENLRFDGFCIEQGLQGLKRLLYQQGMLAEEPLPQPAAPKSFSKSSWLRAPRAGMFRWWKSSGHKVNKGEPLAVINDPYGQDEIPVVAHKDGFIIGHNNAPVVSAGDALFHIAYS